MADRTARARKTTDTRVVGVDRVLFILRALGEYPEGVALEELAHHVQAAKPTVHRALAALKRAGLADQQDNGRYQLGDELLRLAYSFDDARPDTAHVRPILQALSAHFGEATHYAVLDGREVVYRAKVVPSSGGIQLTSVVGGRNPAHSTAVGKLLLALELPSADEVRRWARTEPLVRRTPNTITDPEDLARELARIREQGWSSEDEENEAGVCCVAVPFSRRSPTATVGAVSVSAISYRMPLERLVAQIDHVIRMVDTDRDTTSTEAAGRRAGPGAGP